jgi:hypothetical protein
VIAFAAVAYFAGVLVWYGAPWRRRVLTEMDAFIRELTPLFWVNAGIFACALFLLLEGRLLVLLKGRLAFRGGDVALAQPSRLEVVALEVLGLLVIAGSGLLHGLFLILS